MIAIIFGIQNIFARTRYQVLLQNNHSVGNAKQDRTDISRKISMHQFQAVFSKESAQCIDMFLTMYVLVSYPNIIKFYNNEMDGVDITDKNTAAYRLDYKSKYRFCLAMFLISQMSHM